MDIGKFYYPEKWNVSVPLIYALNTYGSERN